MNKIQRSPIGTPIDQGPWSLILSEEGVNAKMYDSETVTEYLDDGYAFWETDTEVLHWNPRFREQDPKGKLKTWKGNPSGTIWRYVPDQKLDSGVKFKFSMISSKVENHKINKIDYSEKWDDSENKDNLRRVGGTGDFRIGLMQSDGETDMGKWNGYQIRIYPYLHKLAKNHIGESDTSNCSHWYREVPGNKDLLIDDYSQEFSRFKKLKHKGELKFGMGPHAPYDEWFDIEMDLSKNTKGIMEPIITVNGDKVVLDPYEHKTKGFDKEFTKIDTVCISFNNMRPYYNMRIKCNEDMTDIESYEDYVRLMLKDTQRITCKCNLDTKNTRSGSI